MTTQSDEGRVFPRPPLPAVPAEPAAEVPPAPPITVEPVTAAPLEVEPVTAVPLEVEPIGELDTGAESTAETAEPESPPIQGTDLDYLFEVPQPDDPDMEVRDLVSLDVEQDIVGGSLDEATSVSEEDILGDSFDVSDPEEGAPSAPRPRSQRVVRRRPPLPPAGGVLRMR